MSVSARAEDMAATQQQLEQQLKDIEQQIKALEKELATTASQKKTLLAQIKKLETTQAALRLQIKATDIKLKKLTTNIATTEDAIDDTKAAMARQHKELTALLKLIHHRDGQPLLIVLMESGGLAEFFDELENSLIISDRVSGVLRSARAANKQLILHLTNLGADKDDTEQLLQIKTAQQGALLGQLNEQQQLLTETKGAESNYQAALTDTKKQAAEIRSRIYELFGATKNIDFGQALAIAEFVAGKTGIRPAFLLAILTQESNLGKNVGTCNRPGDPPEKGWRVVMKPERDQEPFLKITEQLGLDADGTPVSCPLKDKNGKQFGWGGAMGPAQFIPSTWMGYAGKVSALTGKSPANPWDIRDAFAAASIKLTNDGANGTEEGEWKAAMKYFSGSTNTKYRFYGDNVLKIAEGYEKDIAALKGQ